MNIGRNRYGVWGSITPSTQKQVRQASSFFSFNTPPLTLILIMLATPDILMVFGYVQESSTSMCKLKANYHNIHFVFSTAIDQRAPGVRITVRFLSGGYRSVVSLSLIFIVYTFRFRYLCRFLIRHVCTKCCRSSELGAECLTYILFWFWFLSTLDTLYNIGNSYIPTYLRVATFSF